MSRRRSRDRLHEGTSLLHDDDDKAIAGDGSLRQRTLLFLADAEQGMLNVCNPAIALIRLEMENAASGEVLIVTIST